ncbi:MAG: hypothetical protein AVDCRST_MAG66-1368, partial [uncultured Pseudonocardia sp.]
EPPPRCRPRRPRGRRARPRVARAGAPAPGLLRGVP